MVETRNMFSPTRTTLQQVDADGFFDALNECKPNLSAYDSDEACRTYFEARERALKEILSVSGIPREVLDGWQGFLVTQVASGAFTRVGAKDESDA